MVVELASSAKFVAISRKVRLMMSRLVVGTVLNLSNVNAGKFSSGPFKCYERLFFGKLDPHPPPRKPNNIEHYTFITHFPENLTTLIGIM